MKKNLDQGSFGGNPWTVSLRLNCEPEKIVLKSSADDPTGKSSVLFESTYRLIVSKKPKSRLKLLRPPHWP